MLWLCAHLPRLPLEVFAPADWDTPRPFAVVEHSGNRETILAANGSALTAGVFPGMAAGAAYALVTGLRTIPRDQAREQRALTALTTWALQFSSVVAPCPPAGLLLEAGGSLRLFGGIAPLADSVARGLAELGHACTLACAPTSAAAALLLATNGQGDLVTEQANLRTHLQSLPLRYLGSLGLSARVIELLTGMGLATIGDCLRLPRAGLARRCGPDTPQLLDRLLGKAADPVTPQAPAAYFCRSLPLAAEVTSTEALLSAVQRLLRLLRRYLLSRDGALGQLELRLRHGRVPDTVLTLELVEPSRDSDHLRLLLAQKLDRLALRAPVVELTLRVAEILPFERRAQALFEPDRPAQAWSGLVERLRNRLGKEAVLGLCPHADNRPERAWRHGEPGYKQFAERVAAPSMQRPLWLLPQPRRLALDTATNPRPRGLDLLSRAERIESGWWDGADVARDYYRARDGQGRKLWIYRDRRPPGGWFLHGIFG